MQFQVPQFIETEDKIVGPFSLRQFAYVGVAGILSAMLYFIAQPWLWALGSLILFGLAISLAFVKIEGRPFANVILSAFNFYWKPQTYIWQPEHPTATLPKEHHKKDDNSSLERILAESPKKRVFPVIQHPVVKAEKITPPEKVAPAEPEKPVKPAKPVEPPVIKHPPIVQAAKPAAIVAAKPVEPTKPAESMKPIEPVKKLEPVKKAVIEPVKKPVAAVTRESVSVGAALHKIWENVQTGEPLASKNSDKQFLEKKMAERYQIFQRIAGDRNAAKRIDYR